MIISYINIYLAIVDGVAIETESGEVQWWSDHEMVFPNWSAAVKVTPDLRECPPGKKICMRAILKENSANYTSLERVMNVDFGKKLSIAGYFYSAKENRKQPQNDHVSFK